MRDIDCKQVIETISNLFQEACVYLPDDVLTAIKQARENEESPVAREVLDRILENTKIASEDKTPLCQDTGSGFIGAGSRGSHNRW